MLESATGWQKNGAKVTLGQVMLPTSLGSLDLQKSSLSPQALSIFQLPDFIKSQ